MDWKRARRWAWGLLALFFGCMMGQVCLHWDWLSWLGIAALVAMAVIELVFDRCPHCRAFIGRGENRYCSVCGKSLEE